MMDAVRGRNINDELGLLIEQKRFMKYSDTERFVSVVSDTHKGSVSVTNRSTFPAPKRSLINTVSEKVASIQGATDPFSTADERFIADEPPITSQASPWTCSFPVASRRTFEYSATEPEELRRKSIFAREMEHRYNKTNLHFHQYIAEQLSSTDLSSGYEGMRYLQTARSKSVSGTGLGFRHSEVERIHEENICRLLSMSEEEILKEREMLISSMDPSMIAFLLHEDRRLGSIGPMETELERTKSCTKATSTRRTAQHPTELSSQPLHIDQLESEKLAWTRDLPPIGKKAPELHLQDSGADQSGATVEQPTEKPSTQSQARFDPCGLVVPPDAIVDTHLGLHHHGEEPERAGYTVGELFHLARSSVPSQRRLALATIATSLAQTRRGLHVPSLAPPSFPSLIYGLLSSHDIEVHESEGAGESGGGGGKGGVAFLLRWCLDEAVRSLTSVGSAAAAVNTNGHAVGVSLGLTVECIRGLTNLFCDSYGEASLNSAFEWASTLITFKSISLRPSDRANLFNAQIHGLIYSTTDSKPDSDPEEDHSKLMALDPISFLFTQGQLAQRLSWLLDNRSGMAGIRLPADAAGLWLPALLIRGVRHSSTVAYSIFKIPGLFRVLVTNHLPICDLSSEDVKLEPIQIRPSLLSQTTGVPLPSVLQLCRLTMGTNVSIRLVLVNDFQLVERCCSYLITSTTDMTDVGNLESLVTSLPTVLPLKLAIKLQLEALRCLSTCLDIRIGGSDCIPRHALDTLRTHFPSLIRSCMKVQICYVRHFVEKTNRFDHSLQGTEQLLLPLLGAWLHFFSCAIGELLDATRNLPDNPLHQSFDQLFGLGINLLDHFRGQLPCLQDTWLNIESYLLQKGITPALIAVTINSVVRLFGSCIHFGLRPKTPFQYQLIDLWTNHLISLCTHVVWKQSTAHFIRCGSVLTGAPELLCDVDVITLPVSSTQTANSENQRMDKQTIDWQALAVDTPIDCTLLEPVGFAPSCLPDLGTRVCFRYGRPNGNLATLIWPRLRIPVEDESDTLAIDPTCTYAFPLLVCLVSTLEQLVLQWRLHLASTFSADVLSPLIAWIERLALRNSPPWIPSKNANNYSGLPHTLIALESETAVRALLLMSRITVQDCPLGHNLTKELCMNPKGNLLYLASLRLMPLLRGKQTMLLRELLDDIVFARPQIEFVLRRMEDDNGSVEIVSHLPEIEEVYKKYLLSDGISSNCSSAPTKLPLSSIHEPLDAVDKSSCSLISREESGRLESIIMPLVGLHWAYTPLLALYERSKQRITTSARHSAGTDQEQSLSELTNALRWLLFLCNIQSSHPETTDACVLLDPLAHLAYIFMSSLAYSGAGALGFGTSGVLLVKLVHRIGPFSRMSQRASLETVRLPRSCASFYDLYVESLIHFSALSYNSPAIANLMLWPCQQVCHIKYRRALWGEHQNGLLCVRLRLDQLLLPLIAFLEPEETDESVLRAYASALFSGGVQARRQPVLFLIAVHHLNRYLYNNQNAHKDFTKQLARLLRIFPTSDKTGAKKTGVDRTKLIDVLRRYKQPRPGLMQYIPQLLDDRKLKVDVSDSLTRMEMGSPPPTDDDLQTEFHVAVLEAGIECYASSDLPTNRRSHWEKHFIKN
ncbi:RNA polymerase II-associated protein 1 [Paragonimus heterotremus]|uniref:RNA polymerase II-associated protein 1 n=1 Tax=Paragonimus heterotremus TaxID=100268 RepID=A0A8J4TAM8_9TREM|nr:RNA polymerase II-associated protein 1 [Paragonimus heterotremus]